MQLDVSGCVVVVGGMAVVLPEGFLQDKEVDTLRNK